MDDSKRPFSTMEHSPGGTHPNNPKSRQGSRDFISTLNLDILLYLCPFLHPLDLLHLARTSKSFRQLLMSKSSTLIWKAALLRIKGMRLPEYPSDLNEPQYISLAFETHCHNCSKEGQALFWQFRARYCRSCIELCVTDKRDLSEATNKLIGEPPCLPTEAAGEERLYHLRDVIDLEESTSRLQPHEVEVYIQQRRRLILSIKQHAKRCRRWDRITHRERRMDMPMARKEGVVMWMMMQGWKAEVGYFDWNFVAQHHLINPPTAIKPRVLFALSKRLREWMLILRNVRYEETIYSPRRRILMAEYKEYLKLPATAGDTFELMPHVADVSVFPPFDAIIKSHPHIDITASNFASAFAELPLWVPNWRQWVERQLVESYMRAQYGYPPLSTTPYDHSVILARLRLASTVFVCSDQCSFYASRRMLTYPEVLAYHRFVEPPSIYVRNAIFIAQHTLGGRLWSLQVNKNAKPVVIPFTEAADIIRACHMDPETTTVDEMDRLDARLRCECCLAVLRRDLVMTWRTAMYHAITVHGRHDYDRFTASSPFTLVQGEDDIRARALEGKIETFHEDTIRFICLLCRRSVGDALDSSDMVKHLLGEHEVPKIESGVHYALDPNTAPQILSPVLLEPHQDVGDYSTEHAQHS